MLTIILMTMALEGPVRIDLEEVYRPIFKESIAYADGYLYMTDFQNGTLIRIGKDGEQITIGKKGKGPGEMSHPTQVRVIEDRVYVSDLGQKVVSFDLDGNHIEDFKVQNGPFRTPAGWLGFKDPGFGQESDTQTRLVLMNQEGEITREIAKAGKPRGYSIMIENGVPAFDYEPAKDSPHLVMDRNGKIAWFYNPNTGTIQLLNTTTGDAIKSIKVKGKLKPFDKEWGKEQVAKMSDMTMNGTKVKAKVRGIYPDFFPKISKMSVDAQGRLWTVDGIYAMNPKQSTTTIYAPDGTEVKAPFGFSVNDRVVGLENGSGWLFCFDIEADHAYLLFASENQLPKLAEAHLNEADESGGMQLSVSN